MSLNVRYFYDIDINNMDPESRYDVKKRIRNIKNRISFKNISKNYSFWKRSTTRKIYRRALDNW